MYIQIASQEDGEFLADLRVLAVRKRLNATGRSNSVRARERFPSKFDLLTMEKVIVK